MLDHDFEITTQDANTGPSMRAAINIAFQDVSWNGIQKNLLINPNGKVDQEGFMGEDGVPVLVAVGDRVFDMWKVTHIGTDPTITRNGEEITVSNCRIAQKNDDIIATSNGHDAPLVISVKSGSVGFSDYVDEGALISAEYPVLFTYNSDTASTSIDITIGSTTEIKTFSGLKLEPGNVATKYEIPPITEEQMKCYRYFERITSIGYGQIVSIGVTTTSTSGEFHISFHKKRIAPAFNSYTSGDFFMLVEGVGGDIDSFDANNMTDINFTLRANDTSEAFSPGLVASLYFENTGDFIEFDARY